MSKAAEERNGGSNGYFYLWSAGATRSHIAELVNKTSSGRTATPAAVRRGGGHTDMKRRNISLGFTDEKVPEGLHFCYIYNDDDERFRVIRQYLESGLSADEKVMYLVDTVSPDQLLARLAGVGADWRRNARLTVRTAAEVYCPSGTFSADEMLETVRGFYCGAVAEGRPGARGTGEMSWSQSGALKDQSDLIEYESRLNQFVAQHPMTLCCQYDAGRFDGDTILNVLTVHPYMIVRGRLMSNPYYIEPSVFLKQLYERRRGGHGTGPNLS